MALKVQPSFHPHEPFAAAFPRIVNELVEHALTLTTHPTGEPEEDTREIRTSIKRLRALLLLIRPVVSDRSYARETGRLQDAARRLAASRDIAVARKTVLALAKNAAGKCDRGAFADVLKGFHRAIEPQTKTDQREALRKVAGALRQSGKSIPRLRRHAEEWEVIGPGLEEVYRVGRKRMKRAFARDDDASFHRWRIRVKNLYHLLQMLAPVWPSRLCKALVCLRKLHGKLGDDHDLTVVESILQDAPDAFGGACAIQRVIICLGKRSRQLRKESRKLGRAVFRQRPGRFIGQFEKRWRKWRG
jgi:CHAD domain-containing protein